MTTRYKLPEQIDHEDTQKPLFDDTVQKGGYKVVSSVSHRNAIPILKRTIGSLVNIGGEIREYKGSDVSDTNWFNVNNWQLIGTLSRQVVNSTTEIGAEMPSGSIIHDLDSKIIYQLLTTTEATDTITSLIASGDIEIINSSLPYFTVNGDIAVGGTVDGRDIAEDGEKLDGIEEGAQANVNADWDSVSGDSVILNKPTDVTDLSTHASSELSDGSDLVKGPASSTVGYVAVADDTSGKSIKYVPVAVDDSGNVVISGNATINGTLTTINSETVQVKDKNIEIAKVKTPTDDTADGGGITLLGATNKTITWVKSKLSWVFNQAVEIAGNLNVIGIIKTNGTQISTSDLSDGSNIVKNTGTSTDNAITRFDGTTGKLVQNSSATLDDDGNIAGLKDTATETVTIDSAVQMSYDPVNEELKFTFL